VANTASDGRSGAEVTRDVTLAERVIAPTTNRSPFTHDKDVLGARCDKGADIHAERDIALTLGVASEDLNRSIIPQSHRKGVAARDLCNLAEVTRQRGLTVGVSTPRRKEAVLAPSGRAHRERNKRSSETTTDLERHHGKDSFRAADAPRERRKLGSD
jgi:hypothetical protein